MLWGLIGLTYLDVFVRMSRTSFTRIGKEAAWIFSFATVMAAFSFKLSFAAYDARELVPALLRPVADAHRSNKEE